MSEGCPFPTASMPGTCPGCGVNGTVHDWGTEVCCVKCHTMGKPRKESPESLLDTAKRLTSHDRNKAYGHPKEDFARIAVHWGAILGVVVTPKQVALCMIAVKIARECHSTKLDNWVDIAGYARCGAAVEGLEEL